MSTEQTHPGDAQLRARRRAAIATMLRCVARGLELNACSPSLYDDTEEEWSEEFFDRACWDSLGIEVNIELQFHQALLTEHGTGGRLNDGLKTHVFVSSEIFAGCSRRQNEHAEMMCDRLGISMETVTGCPLCGAELGSDAVAAQRMAEKEEA